MELIAHAVDVAQKAGLSVEPNDVAEGMAAFIEIILKQSGATPEQMQQMVGGMDSGAGRQHKEADMGMGMLFAGALTGGAQAMGQMADQAYKREDDERKRQQSIMDRRNELLFEMKAKADMAQEQERADAEGYVKAYERPRHWRRPAILQVPRGHPAPRAAVRA